MSTLLETTAFLHHPRTKAIVQRIAEYRLVPDRIEVCLAFPASDQFLDGLREDDEDPLGVAGDLGWFAARWGILLFDVPALAVSARRTGQDLLPNRPLAALCHERGQNTMSHQTRKDHSINLSPPAEVQAIVAFGNGRELHMHCSYRLAFRQRLEILQSHSKTLTCNDCLYPARGAEVPATYFLQTHANPPLQDLDHILLATTQEIQTPLKDQRICMLDAFAELCLFNHREDIQAKRQAHFDAAINTQLIINAILVSANNSGALVTANLPANTSSPIPAVLSRPRTLSNQASNDNDFDSRTRHNGIGDAQHHSRPLPPEKINSNGVIRTIPNTNYHHHSSNTSNQCVSPSSSTTAKKRKQRPVGQ